MRKKKTMDGNTAAAYISYAFTELAAIYPITPSSTMAELVDQWATQGKKNIFGQPVSITEMQSEAGAAGVVHGALKTGALTTTYTASQGLLLMIPNMYKIAGELLPGVFHVASRAVTTNALNIFGDHGDVMAARQTGFAMLQESSVQEVMDLSAVAHLAAIEGSIPFMNFFDGFRTSHEIQKVEVIEYDELAPLIDQEKLKSFRKRSMNPNHPTISGTNQNPDIHFQQRETVNRYYEDLPAIVQKYMFEINKLRGTNYDLVTYYGAEDAEEVIVAMGSVAQTIEQTVDYLNAEGRKVGFLNIHLYRPFPTENFLEKLPASVKSLAVLDRSKEPGADGEPLLLDIQSVMYESDVRPKIIGGRFGLGSKDVTPDQIIAVYDELLKDKQSAKKRFTIGIVDDVTHMSLESKEIVDLTNPKTFQAKFWGFGSDGTVGANKSAIKIIGDHTDKYAQGYFYYDSKKSGGLTVSHLRFGDTPIRSTYLVESADFIACHTPAYIHTYDLLKGLKPGGIFLMNTMWNDTQMDKLLPAKMKRYIAENEIKFYTINAAKLAMEVGLGQRINTVMETAFFSLTGIIPFDEVLGILKEEADKSYRRKSVEIVEKNQAAIDQTVELLHQVQVPKTWRTVEIPKKIRQTPVSQYVEEILEPVNSMRGNDLTVNDLVVNGMTDGTIPTGTTTFEKRGVALEVPHWISDRCTMCNECSFVCPHAAIRPFLADDEELGEAPEGYIVREMRGADGLKYRIQVSIEDCTGCGLCVEACPAKEKALVMKPYEEEKEQAINWAFSMTLKQKANPAKTNSVLGSQFNKPLLEFSGACAGCGETPYVKLMTQMFGDRMMIANATGCSSIWGAAAPVSPYTTNDQGQGPAWSNSLFEDNAEFGYGMFLANQTRRKELADKINNVLDSVSEELRELMEDWMDHMFESEGTQQRATKLTAALEESLANPQLAAIYEDRDLFVKTSQWMFGGDGWAYDIGFGGIDHILASGADVNILVMDNEVYSNTGGQTSKATPASAIAKFSAGGKYQSKKDLGMMAMTYGNVYVAQIASGANQMQTIKALEEAEKFPGPSLIIAYTPCINHGLRGGMSQTLREAKEAVESGYWSLYRYNPAQREKGKNPMTLDYKKPDFSEMIGFMKQQNRFSALERIQPDDAQRLYQKTVNDAETRFYNYARLAGQEEKIRAKLSGETATVEKTAVAVKPKREKNIDPEAEARRAARRAARAEKRNK
ncbi:pyruvate:ferredoxin (flavodoxin) oxidoreductase [Enterococcus hermanniensis]|uniref:Pyruvate:ferredoxin (Flavodoxin) oxidoreductase n=1 Tax=Enterococcus hermanniensis TaxID=249189 RepID=A0A1L8TG45_9ENTE|nr:pyruvate:ferredoxin (flavodoxin) oxidoreductase [Enterococcus hermanniensis]OJG43270.1 pyruvate:ferredoxin (flavodoxin) oxidoreductase [Enterococcus hermanniensis]